MRDHELISCSIKRYKQSLNRGQPCPVMYFPCTDIMEQDIFIVIDYRGHHWKIIAFNYDSFSISFERKESLWMGDYELISYSIKCYTQSFNRGQPYPVL